MFTLTDLFNDLIKTDLKETEILFESEDGKETYEVTGSYKSKCKCCDQPIFLLQGRKL